METVHVEEPKIEVIQVEDGEVTAATAVEVELVRELARQAYPDAIPELISGESVEEVVASVEVARAAYARVFAEIAERPAAVIVPPVVPAGGSSAVLVDVEALPVSEKLRRGVLARQ